MNCSQAGYGYSFDPTNSLYPNPQCTACALGSSQFALIGINVCNSCTILTGVKSCSPLGIIKGWVVFPPFILQFTCFLTFDALSLSLFLEFNDVYSIPGYGFNTLNGITSCSNCAVIDFWSTGNTACTVCNVNNVATCVAVNGNPSTCYWVYCVSGNLCHKM